MNCHRKVLILFLALIGFSVTHLASRPVAAQPAPDPARTVEASPGQLFVLIDPISDLKIQELKTSVSTYLTRLATRPATEKEPAGPGKRPILIFEFREGSEGSGATSFGAATDLADYLQKALTGARKTVAYVPESLSGYAVIPVLACDEIVMGPGAELGPILPEGQTAAEREKAVLTELARTKSREIDLLLGLLDPSLDLREVRTPDATHFVLADRLKEFGKDHEIVDERPAWESKRGVLTAEHARRTIAQLLAADRSQLAQAYGLPSASLDPTLGARATALVIPINGIITTLNESFLLRQIARARQENVNLVFFQLNTEGGLFEEANKIATAISELKDIRTVAFLDDRAIGVSSLIALACDEIVFRPGSKMGDVTLQVVDNRGTTEKLDDRMTEVLADRAEDLARLKGRPPAVARAMIDPGTIIHLARDNQTGAVRFVPDREVLDNPGQFQVLETPKSADGSVLTLNEDNAVFFRMSDRTVNSFDELVELHGVSPESLKQAQRTWVDALVDTLNETWLKGILLFLGFFLLMLEIKLPGIGLPAILSALCFLLYFWSSYLGGTADQLEIMLFVLGIICLGLELFVFPGFGVFGMSGVFLILISVIMASHTFSLPTREYEYRQLASSLLQIVAVIGGVIMGAVLLSRYLPSLPVFNRLVLKPQISDGSDSLAMGAKPALENDAPLSFLLGEVGRTTTVLKPSGKVRFGELLVDVTADGFYIEGDQAVEVVEVRGSRVIVKRV